jgi:acyl dehydratase
MTAFLLHDEERAMTSVFETNATITDEMVDEVRKLIGRDLRVSQYNEFAAYDTIRHYAFGIGDDNPLWCDEAYAATTQYGVQLAPPIFLCSIIPSSVTPGLPGIQPLKVGDKWTWYRPTRLGDRIRARAKLTGVEVVEGRTAGRMVKQLGEIEYETIDGEPLAKVETQHLRVMRQGAEGGGLSYAAQEPHQYTESELDRIAHDVFAEERRGAEPRYWEDVKVGDEIPAVVKGPLDQISMTCYYAGAIGTPGYKACELRWKQWKQANEAPETMPGNYPVDYFQERVLPSLGHQDHSVARAIGMPGAYDNGHQRMGWLTHAVTNWMGDDGFLKELSIKIERPNVFGNTTWFTGRVTDVFDDGGQPCVSADLQGESQTGEINTTATAIVALPTRKQV